MKFSPSCMEAMWERWRSLALTHSRSHSSCTLRRCHGLSRICRHRDGGALDFPTFTKHLDGGSFGWKRGKASGRFCSCGGFTGAFFCCNGTCERQRKPVEFEHLLCYQNKAESVTEIIRGSAACQVLPFTSANKSRLRLSPFKCNQTCSLSGKRARGNHKVPAVGGS